MKIKIIIIVSFFVLINNFCISQTFKISNIVNDDGSDIKDLLLKEKQTTSIQVNKKELNAFTLIPNDLVASKEYKIKCSNVQIKQGEKFIAEHRISVGLKEIPLEFEKDIIGKVLQIDIINADHTPENPIRFIFTKKQDADNKNPPNSNSDIEDYLKKYLPENSFSSLKITPFGFIDPKDKNNIIHIFFDQYGTNLLGTIPQGVANAQYMVHIIYQEDLIKQNNITYSVRIISGGFNSSIQIYNNISKLSLSKLQSKNKDATEETQATMLGEKTFLLLTSTEDLSFEIIATTEADNKLNKNVLETYTIKMSPTYNASFDVGLLKTDLSNPNFSMVKDATSTFQVLKKSDDGSRGVAAIMATFYTSPVVLIEKYLMNKNFPFYKLTGRNFLDDHTIWERIYPAIGVSLNSSTFQNIFYGFNWEIARGLSIFYGWHYGKVNVFEMPDLTEGVTPITQSQFDLYSKTKWKTAECFGVKADIMIISNLFQGSGK